MSWPFVGRTEQVDFLRSALTADSGPASTGPIVLTGEPGIGRSALLNRAVQSIVEADVVVLTAAGPASFATIAPLVGPVPDGPIGARVATVATELAGHAPRVVVLDDAHLADVASMLVLRTLCRAGRTRLIITRPSDLHQAQLPDPTECLRYERDAVTLRLPPLARTEVAELLTATAGEPVHRATVAALHSASGGSPRVLRELVAGGRLTDCLVAGPDGPRLREPGDADPVLPLPDTDADRLVAATGIAWYELELDQVEELCRLAAWRGVGDRMLAIRATVLLLHGHPRRCLRVLDSIADGAPHLALIRAAALALGLHQTSAASDYLLGVANTVPALRYRAPAYRAWLLAIAGHRVDVPLADGDRETTVFCCAARAALALASGRAAEAVGQLRRALAAAEGCRADMPWLPPFLMACLIDALMLAGRIKEATETAAQFHRGREISGVIAALASRTMAALTVRAANEGHSGQTLESTVE